MVKLSDVIPQKYFIYIPDNLFLRLLYFQKRRKLPDLQNPKTYSEKMTWMKIYGHLEDYSMYADKYAVRNYVKKTIGEKYLVPLIGSWRTVDEIPINKLPKKFVIKTNHGAGYNFICKDKSKLDINDMKTKLNQWLSENYYDFFREAQYKNINPRIVCEKYMEDEHGELRDYKICCFNGVPKVIELHYARDIGHKVAVYNTVWQRMPFNVIDGTDEILPQPDNLSDLLKTAGKLARGLPFARIDLYSVRGKIYFGEISFTPMEGFPFLGNADLEMGKLLDINGFKHKAKVKSHSN
jgi:TupA-like ATPgrasp